MNAERLHVIARAIRDEMTKLNLVENLEQIRDSLQRSINQPQQQAAFQETISQKLAEIYKSLENAPSNKFSPAWRQILGEINAEDLLGQQLAARLRNIFERNQITPATALKEIQELHQQVSQLKSAVEQICSAFRTIKIPAEDLEPGECELGVLVPRVAVDNRLREFADELDEIHFILSIFQEVVTGKREDFEIRTISSSDLSVYLEIMPPVAACIAIALDRLIETYKKILEIRKLHSELKKQEVPEDALKGIEQHANQAMEAGIDTLIPDILDTYSKAKDERRNELANACASVSTRWPTVLTEATILRFA